MHLLEFACLLQALLTTLRMNFHYIFGMGTLGRPLGDKP